MNFRLIDKLALESACGRYRVAKYFLCGSPRYEAWRIQPDKLVLGRCESAAEARRLCEQDVPRNAEAKNA